MWCEPLLRSTEGFDARKQSESGHQVGLLETGSFGVCGTFSFSLPLDMLAYMHVETANLFHPIYQCLWSFKTPWVYAVFFVNDQ